MSPARSLVHPGFAKAGSTFLQEWFARNPDLRFTAHSIAGFSNVFQLADLVHEKPGKTYRYFVTSNELLGSGGRIPYDCPLFCFRQRQDLDFRKKQKEVCSHLHAIFPDSRVVIVTRGFSGIIRSLYSQYIKLGGRRDFLEFVTESAAGFVQWLDVDYNIGLYREAFGESHVLVFPYELLKADPGGFLLELERFLELEHFDYVPSVKNPSLPPDRAYWYGRVSRHIVSPIADRFNPSVAGRIYNFYGFKIVQTDRFGPAIGLLNRIHPRSASMEFPDGYLDAFRGLADSLATDARYRTLGREYLFGRGSEQQPANTPASTTISASRLVRS